MICKECNKDVKQPLELYDGRWACPYCKKNLMLSGDSLSFTHENNELFVLSDKCYYTYLTRINHVLARTDVKECQTLLNKAIDLCRQSAYLGNPNAIIRLGYYYDKDYVEVNRSEEERCRIAYQLYKKVWKSDEKSDNLGIDADEWLKIKKYAARLTIEMLANASDELRKTSPYTLEENLKDIEDCLGYAVNVRSTNCATIPQTITVFSTLVNFNDKDNAPLFGFFKVSIHELYQILEMTDTNGNIEQSGYDIVTSKQGHGTYVYLTPNNGKKSTQIYTLSNKRFINDILKNKFDMDDSVFVCFVNGRGAHKYLSNGQINKVRKCFEENFYGCIDKLKELKYANMVFYDSDLFVHMVKSRNVKKAMEALMDELKNN